MKRLRFITLCCIFFVLFSVFSFSASAESTDESSVNEGCVHTWVYDPEEGLFVCAQCLTIVFERPEGDIYGYEEPVVEEPPEPNHTLVSRVWEYFEANKTEILGLAGDAVIFLLAIFVKIRNDKRTKGIASDLKIVKGDAKGTADAQSSVVDAVNGMIEGYNGMRSSYEEYGNTERDRNKLVGAVMVQNTAILEMLSTVYVNNKNLPQGVKDLINLRYSNCLKALGNDETLCAIVETVREKICTSTESTEESAEMKEESGVMEV